MDPLMTAGPATRAEAIPPTRRLEPAWVQVARVLVLVAALGIILLGLVVGGAGSLLSAFRPDADQLGMLTLSVAFLVLAVGLGSMLAWHALRAVLGRPSAPFQPRRVWLWILLFALAVVVGQALLATGRLTSLAFPPFHLAAGVLPAVVILAAMGRTLNRAARWRDLILQVSSGAFLATFLAFTLELLALGGLIAAVLVGVALLPGGTEILRTLAERVQDPALIQDSTLLSTLADSPLVVAAILFVFSILIPIIEETVKTLGVGLMAYQRPTLSRALLWGVAGGAGFAMSEGLLNAASGLDGWVFVITLRVGTTLLHCFTGALVGLAWYFLLIERRWLRALLLYAAGVGMHGLWNALAAAISVISLRTYTLDAELAAGDLSNAGIVVIIGILISIALAVAVGLYGLTRYARDRSRENAVPSPLLEPAPEPTN